MSLLLLLSLSLSLLVLLRKHYPNNYICIYIYIYIYMTLASAGAPFPKTAPRGTANIAGCEETTPPEEATRAIGGTHVMRVLNSEPAIKKNPSLVRVLVVLLTESLPTYSDV